MKFPRVDSSKVGDLLVHSLFFGVMFWMGTAAGETFSKQDAAERLLALQRGLYEGLICTIAMCAIAYAFIFFRLRNWDLEMPLREKIEWAITIVILVVAFYLYFAA